MVIISVLLVEVSRKILVYMKILHIGMCLFLFVCIDIILSHSLSSFVVFVFIVYREMMLT